MADTTEEEFREEIAAIVKDADLSGLTARKVRRQLEEKFGADFTERKGEIDGILIELINEKTDSQEDSDADERNGENGTASDSSVSDVSVMESDEKKAAPKKKAQPARKKPQAKPAAKPRSKATSKVKSKPEVVSSDDEKNLDDEELARKLQEEENGGRPRRRTAKKVKPPKSDKPKKPRAAGTSIYSRPCDLTPELAAVMGTDKMPRKDVVKNMWEIVRERNLQDPSNRQFMLCDEQLLKVFGKKRVRTFGMMKYLKKHMV
ncbi:uncharacterized protein LOC135489094 [Lineus longissimus]|uniref:uncharacterized protein LOC135489094 n=1 Tax=Lineus longissimus TaxID=88925 RepID=UPI002B4C4381